MAIFLTTQQAYRLFQRELPEGAYADGSPSAFFTTASVYAKAELVKKAYDNMNRIYQNMFPQSADEQIADWEIKVFGYRLDASLDLPARQQALILKLRQHPGINRQAIIDIINTSIGTGFVYTIIDWNCDVTGGWLLDESQLDIETYLNAGNMVDVTPSLFPGKSLCVNDPAFGKTDQEWLEMREQAYTYEILIYGATLTAEQREALDKALTKGEPARSTHVITDGLDPNDMSNGVN